MYSRGTWSAGPFGGGGTRSRKRGGGSQGVLLHAAAAQIFLWQIVRENEARDNQQHHADADAKANKDGKAEQRKYLLQARLHSRRSRL